MFNTLLKFLQKNPKDKITDTDLLLDLIKGARLFNFTASINQHVTYTSDIALKDMLPDFSSLDASQLLLPFDIIALVHPDSILLLQAAKELKLSFMYCGLTKLQSSTDLVYYVLYFGLTESLNGTASTKIKHCYIVTNGSTVPIVSSCKPIPNKQDADIVEFCEFLAVKQLYDLATINTLDRFIVEIAPSGAHPVKGKKFIPRSHQRPEYIILHPKEIRKLMRLPDLDSSDKASRAGHERRAHLRCYPNDKKRWPNMAGKTIQIAAIWIGPSEAEFDGKQYRVILD